MLTTARYILLTSLRDRLFVGLYMALFVSLMVSDFLGGTALAEQMQMKIAYASGVVRVLISGGMIVFVCFHVRRAFDNREIEVMLTRPISRHGLIIAYWLGFAIISCLLLLPIIIFLWQVMSVNPTGLLFWGSSMLLEVLMVVAFAIFCSLILKSAITSVLLSFGFYVVSRMMGFFLYIFENPIRDISLLQITEDTLKAISYVVPRFDLYVKSDWLIYGIGSGITDYIFIIQSLIYIPLILLMGIFDFQRKEF